MTESQTSVVPLPRRVYYGWVMVGMAAAAMVGTLPGRTQGLGLITEPLLAELGISRVDYAQINLVATLAGALFAFGVGSLIDRIGARLVVSVVAAALGVVVVAMSQLTGLVTLAVMVTLTRGLGQTALSIVSLAMVGKWFRRRLTWAMAVYTVTMSVGFMLAFPAVGALVLSAGWRPAWGAVGVALLILAAASWRLVRSTPADIGDEIDGGPATVAAREAMDARDEAAAGVWSADGRRESHASDALTSHVAPATLWDALGTPAFWVFSTASALYGLVASGIGLFNEAILAERGFAPDVYHTALAVVAITGLGGNFVAGARASRGSLRGVLVAAMAMLAAGLAVLPHVSTVTHVMAQAVAMGVSGGFVMVVFFSFWGRTYGDTHLGRIQGAAQVMTVLGSAVGPLALAWCVETTGSYAMAFYALAATLVALGAAAAAVRIPHYGATAPAAGDNAPVTA